jgi:hypothetical protein
MEAESTREKFGYIVFVSEDGRFIYKHYTVKKRMASFPSLAGMSLPNSPWAGIMTS